MNTPTDIIDEARRVIDSPLTMYSSPEYRRIIQGLLALATPPKIDAWAVRNNQGYWVGIWNDPSIARMVRSKGQQAHGERVVALAIIEEDPR